MYKKLYRDIEKLLRRIDSAAGTEDMLRMTMRGIVETCAPVYGIESARLYRAQTNDYLLIESIGGLGSRIVGKTVSRDYPVVQALEREHIVMISRDYPGFDPELEAQFSSLDYAAILVDASPAYILSFGVRRGELDDEPENLHLILETIRTAVGLKLRQGVLESQLRQAQTIQLSLLPRELPKLPGFELAAATFPAEEVGGDIYDAQATETGTITVAVADASGHGLPAALQARDVITGLRMGVARDFKITATIRRLNKVINSSGLSSRFVSLFYTEIEETGTVIYVNCGHCPPVIVNPEGPVFELPSNGPVLGPLPDMTYRRSFAQLRPGEVLCIYSDGLTERKRPVAPVAGEPTTGGGGEPELEEFGTARMIEVVRRNAHCSAREILAAIITASREFGGDDPWEDDATLLIVRRLPASEFKPKRTMGTVLSFEQARVGSGRKPADPKA